MPGGADFPLDADIRELTPTISRLHHFGLQYAVPTGHPGFLSAV
jgi:hypothetical protein